MDGEVVDRGRQANTLGEMLSSGFRDREKGLVSTRLSVQLRVGRPLGHLKQKQWCAGEGEVVGRDEPAFRPERVGRDEVACVAVQDVRRDVDVRSWREHSVYRTWDA